MAITAQPKDFCPIFVFLSFPFMLDTCVYISSRMYRFSKATTSSPENKGTLRLYFQPFASVSVLIGFSTSTVSSKKMLQRLI